jgi:AcrR family transcriptional regulator
MPQINITIDVSDTIYLRDPLETGLGKKIIQHSINLFHEVGFEDFNFKKLANRMGSTEASVYRYFENKYKLLAYLVAWYWDFIHFMILIETRNVSNLWEKLYRIVDTLVNSLKDAPVPEYIDHEKLHTIVVENASKVYHNKQVDTLKQAGFYTNFKKLVTTIAEGVKSVDPTYRYPVALATNIVEVSLNNEYYLEHLPGLTDVQNANSLDAKKETIKMIKHFLDRALRGNSLSK